MSDDDKPGFCLPESGLTKSLRRSRKPFMKPPRLNPARTGLQTQAFADCLFPSQGLENLVSATVMALGNALSEPVSRSKQTFYQSSAPSKVRLEFGYGGYQVERMNSHWLTQGN